MEEIFGRRMMLHWGEVARTREDLVDLRGNGREVGDAGVFVYERGGGGLVSFSTHFLRSFRLSTS